jgi:hypothetical protein
MEGTENPMPKLPQPTPGSDQPKDSPKTTQDPQAITKKYLAMGCEMVVKANDGPDGWQGVIFGCNKADIEKNMTKNKMTHYAIPTEGAPPKKPRQRSTLSEKRIFKPGS